MAEYFFEHNVRIAFKIFINFEVCKIGLNVSPELPF